MAEIIPIGRKLVKRDWETEQLLAYLHANQPGIEHDFADAWGIEEELWREAHGHTACGTDADCYPDPEDWHKLPDRRRRKPPHQPCPPCREIAGPADNSA